MLRKLIKYEFKATSGFMLLMYGLLLAMSALISIGLKLNVDELIIGFTNDFEIGKMLIGIFAFMIVALFIVLNVVVLSGMFFYAISRFKSNLLGSEGYLTHTLPVKTSAHIISKCLVACIWTILSIVAVVLSYMIIILGISESHVFLELMRVFKTVDLSNYITLSNAFYLLEVGVLCLVTLIGGYLHIYASMSIGFSSNTHQIAKSIGVYILISIASSILETIIISPLAVFDIATNMAMNRLLYSPHILLNGATIIAIIEAAIYYFISIYFLSRKLNLQ